MSSAVIVFTGDRRQEADHAGTCELVKGPINPNGYCDQWMKKPVTVG